MKKNCQIIYLNGTSSSGKTTIARELRETLVDLFIIMDLDTIILMMPEKSNNWRGEANVPGFSWQPVLNEHGEIIAHALVVGPFAKKMLRVFKNIVVTMALAGVKIIIDDVCLGQDELHGWQEALKNFVVCWVGVTAPLEVLEARERKRGDRMIGTARWQLQWVHKGISYDICVNSAEQTLHENVQLIKKVAGLE